MSDDLVLRLLIDACLTRASVAHLVAVFGGQVDAVHVDAVMAPATDDNTVFAYAASERRIIFTANGDDFLALARRQPTHSGLGLINDQNTRERQVNAIEGLARALLVQVAAGGAVAAHVFVMRRIGRLVVRKYPEAATAGLAKRRGVYSSRRSQH